MSLSPPPPVQRLTGNDGITEPWYRFLSQATNSINNLLSHIVPSGSFIRIIGSSTSSDSSEFDVFGTGAGLYGSTSQFLEMNGNGIQALQFGNNTAVSGDVIGRLDFQTSNASQERYVEVRTKVISDSSGAESGALEVRTINSGFASMANEVSVGDGLIVGPGATFPGTGNIALSTGQTLSNLPASPTKGMMAVITDSNTATWGATITGSSSTTVLAWYNGTNWTVMGS